MTGDHYQDYSHEPDSEGHRPIDPQALDALCAKRNAEGLAVMMQTVSRIPCYGCRFAAAAIICIHAIERGGIDRHAQWPRMSDRHLRYLATKGVRRREDCQKRGDGGQSEA